MAASVQKQKIVPKYIVKYLSNYIPISSEDITNPNSERIVDIYWIVCCHIYGESELLESMRGSTLKRLTLVILLRQLFDRLLPTLNPPFTAKDFIFPTKDRTAIFLNAIVNFMKISEAQSDCREKLAEERQKIEERQETLQRELLNMATKKHELHEKSDAIHLEYDNLKDRQLCSLKRSEKKSSQVQTLQEKVEQRKYDVKQRTETTATLSRQIAENQERVEYLQINSLPSKEEFVKALENNKQEVAELEVHYMTSCLKFLFELLRQG
ncbi:hypothetical protein EB796_019103 [Bugula neritina]|uniref:Kinetochore protein Nuf2 N-terminal domain-containing protein n=1 Tax=Bugula neritina TaxID=10212 RepID=A0A7J7J985_BUGNE|nr:hypothetical protein EB796_019103 [Bugula neritina]